MSGRLTEAEEKRKSSTLPLGLPWFVKCLRLYATFEGRARRREFLVWMAYGAAIAFLSSLLTSPTPPPLTDSSNTVTISPDALIASMALPFTVKALLFLPGLSVTVRRLHDTGKSGWWALLPYAWVLVAFAMVALAYSQTVAIILTVVGFCFIGYFLYLVLSDSQPGRNGYGENPKGINRVFPDR